MSVPQKQPPLPPSVLAALLSAGAAVAKFLLGFLRRKKVDKVSNEEAALGAAEDVVEDVIKLVPQQKDK